MAKFLILTTCSSLTQHLELVLFGVTLLGVSHTLQGCGPSDQTMGTETIIFDIMGDGWCGSNGNAFQVCREFSKETKDSCQNECKVRPECGAFTYTDHTSENNCHIHGFYKDDFLKTETTPAPQTEFSLAVASDGLYGSTNVCAEGMTVIIDSAACQASAGSFGSWSTEGSWSDTPRYCYLDQESNAVFFNSHPTGGSGRKRTSICGKATAAPPTEFSLAVSSDGLYSSLNVCEDDMRVVSDISVCEANAGSFGSWSWWSSGSWPDTPRHCYFDPESKTVFFNNHPTGGSGRKRTNICGKAGTSIPHQCYRKDSAEYEKNKPIFFHFCTLD